MGATFDYIIYESDDKKEIQSEWIEDQEDAAEEYLIDYVNENFDDEDDDYDYESAMDEAKENLGYSGMINTLSRRISWVNIDPLDSEKAATEYLEKNHEKWSDTMGVPFNHEGKINYMVGGWCSD